MIVSLLTIIFFLLGFIVWFFQAKAFELLNDERYIEEFDKTIVLSVPRKTLSGKVAIVLEYLGYLTDREEILPIDKKDGNKSIPILTYQLTHLGFDAKQGEGRIIFLFLVLRFVFLIIAIIMSLVGLLAAIVTLSLFFREDREIIVDCINTSENILVCIPKILFGQ